MLAEKLLLGGLQAIHVSDTGRDFSWPAPSPEYLFQGVADRFLRERNAVKAFSANHKMPPAGTTFSRAGHALSVPMGAYAGLSQWRHPTFMRMPQSGSRSGFFQVFHQIHKALRLLAQGINLVHGHLHGF